MNAKEAKQISIESKEIMGKITEAAFKGETSITCYSLSSKVVDGLRTLGYDVCSYPAGFNETNYEISWK